MKPKFRAFWLKEKIMTNIDAIYFLEGGIKVENGCCYSEFAEDGNVVLMQSTGIKDKNGVEIYEGDIVEITEHPFDKDGSFNNNFVIEWSNESLTYLAGALILARLKPYITVKGNIYENPELLEVQE